MKPPAALTTVYPPAPLLANVITKVPLAYRSQVPASVSTTLSIEAKKAARSAKTG